MNLIIVVEKNKSTSRIIERCCVPGKIKKIKRKVNEMLGAQSHHARSDLL